MSDSEEPLFDDDSDDVAAEQDVWKEEEPRESIETETGLIEEGFEYDREEEEAMTDDVKDEDADEYEDEDEDTAELQTRAIIAALQETIPEVHHIVQPEKSMLTQQSNVSSRGSAPRQPMNMTDIGYRASQLAIQRRQPVKHVPAIATLEGESEEQEEELFDDSLISRRRKTGVRGRPKRVDLGFGRSTTHNLPPQAARLMGQANMAYVSRNLEAAVPLFLEVVRLSPSSPEPYTSLGLIYEEAGELEKAASYYLIAAHLNSTDKELWARVAKLSKELGRDKDTLYALTKVIQSGDHSEKTYWERADLQLSLGEPKQAVTGLYGLLRRSREDMKICKLIARFSVRHQMSSAGATLFDRLISTADDAGRPCNFSHLNILVDLLMVERDYLKTTEAIEAHAPKLLISTAMPTDWYSLDKLGRLQRSLASMPVDLKVRYAIAMLYLNRGDQLDLLALGQALDPQIHADLMLAMGVACFEKGRHALALELFLPLMDIPEYGNVQLCLRIAHCYKHMRQDQLAVEAFSAVLEVDPRCEEARLSLSELYRKMGSLEMSAKVLQEAPSDETAEEKDVGDDSDWQEENSESEFDGRRAYQPLLRLSEKRKTPIKLRRRRKPGLRLSQAEYDAAQCEAMQQKYRRAMLLSELVSGRDNYRECGMLFNGLLTDFLNNGILYADGAGKKRRFEDVVRNRLEKAMADGHAEFSSTVRPDLAALHGLSIEEWHELLVRFGELDARYGDDPIRTYGLLSRAKKASIFAYNPIYSHELQLLIVGVLLHCKRHDLAFASSRYFLRVLGARPVVFTLLQHTCLATGKASEKALMENDRYLTRWMQQEPSSIAMAMLAGHAHMAGANWDDAYRCYVSAYRLEQNSGSGTPSALILLCLAVALLHRALRRTCPQPIQLAHQSVAFIFKYAKAEDHSLESMYNLGRTFHTLGMMHLAQHYYRHVLDSKDDTEPDRMGARKNAAYNLAIIYRQSGSGQLASELLRTHCSF